MVFDDVLLRGMGQFFQTMQRGTQEADVGIVRDNALLSTGTFVQLEREVDGLFFFAQTNAFVAFFLFDVVFGFNEFVTRCKRKYVVFFFNV